MPSADYTNTTSGALKLKGGGGKISKKKHRSHKSNPHAAAPPSTVRDISSGLTERPSDHDRDVKSPGPTTINTTTKTTATTATATVTETETEEAEEDALIARAKHITAIPNPETNDDEEAKDPRTSHKTDAEKRHEATRRRRLDEILKRKGSKTHKERVEELNRYLAGLSEHHDMPRIGPG
ncbi:MAG: hypothetical protein M1828_004851 [Chrysothrix sp. TS-e1954]|nr:MAG: hypothetical protein M1828_004851 [Chrysothrix sp. TS-e1954]